MTEEEKNEATGDVETGAEAPEAAESAEAPETTEAVEEETGTGRGNRKTLVGIVVSDKMSKTRIVKVKRQEMHRRYKKFISRDTKYAAHDENAEGQEISKAGDKVLIQETRPYSKTKRWRIVKVLS